MTYEEKLDLILKAIIEAKKATIRGRSTKLHINEDNGLNRIGKEEVQDILQKIEAEEKILSLNDIVNRLLPLSQQPKVEYLLLNILDTFEPWYTNYLIKQKSSLAEMNYLNLLRVLDTLLSIREKIQLNQSATVGIPLLPQRIRFRELFLADDVGQRDEFIQGRWDSLGYLKKETIIKDFRLIDNMMHRWDNEAEVTINPATFYDFIVKVKAEVSKRLETKEQKQETSGTEQELTTNTKNSTPWPDDFKKEGKTFIFGQYGKFDLQSPDRLRILQVLFEKQGGWATINELKGTQDAGYVRSTIKQIEDRFPEEVKKHIKIISTQEDDSENKPASGAYKIVISQKPKPL